MQKLSEKLIETQSHCAFDDCSDTKNFQRAVVDFGAEDSFALAAGRLWRHHGVVLCASSVRKITLEHARRIEASQRASGGGQGALPRAGAGTIMAGMDGTMLPIVQTSKTKDRSASSA